MNSFNSYNANLTKGKNIPLKIMVNNQVQNITPSSGVYTIYIKSSTTFSINKSLPIDFTLVSGGGGSGTGNGDICGAGGGGGHVFNYYGYNVTNAQSYYFNIGAGGTAINGYTNGTYSNKPFLDTYIKMTNSLGNTAQDSSSNLLTTTFSTYGGGGGQGYGGGWWDGMGGAGSDKGLSTTIQNYAPGGGGGTQTVIINGIRTNNRGNKGGNSSATSGGAGGAGHTGIDNNYYGGGGAGGATGGRSNPGATGGIGGGQNGNNVTANTPRGKYNINGTFVDVPRNGAIGEQGGGGGGGVTNTTGYTVVSTPAAGFVTGATGAEGIAIIKIKYP